MKNTNSLQNFGFFVTAIATILLVSIPATNSFAVSNMTSIMHHAGPIASINNNWILAGQWMGFIDPSNVSDAGFHSTFHMAMVNGSAPHMHKIYNATATSINQEGKNFIIKGFSTVTMKEGPVSNVPTTWTVSNNNTLAISLDPSKVSNHFGNTPIYGLIVSPDAAKKFVQNIMDDSKFLKKWMPLMMQDMIQEMKMSKDNKMYMPMEGMNHSMSGMNNSKMMVEKMPSNNSMMMK